MRATAALLGVVLTVSCAGPAAQPTPWPGQALGEHTVTFIRPGTTPQVSPTIPVGTAVRLLGNTFDPQVLEVPLGSTVIWTSRDGALHTVTSGTFGRPDGLFDREVHGGGTFSFAFALAGTYSYYCKLHGGMQARLIVR